MNRQERRAARKARKPSSAFEHRVAPGRIALTFDFEGHNPSTLEINAASLADVLAGLDREMVGRSYEWALTALRSAVRASQAGEAAAEDCCLLGYWLAFNHPAGGDGMRRQVADRMAGGERVHITMYAGRSRGVAFALADRFVDLATAMASAKSAGVGVVAAANRPGRPGRVVQ